MATTEAVDAPGIPRLLRAVSRSSLVAIAVGALAILSGVVTYIIIARLASYSPSDSALSVLLLVNLGIDLALGAIIAWRLTRLWVEYRTGAAGARLHARLVGIFSLIVIVPAILVAVFATITVNVAFKAWFADPTKTMIMNSEEVARRYVHQQGLMILSDAQDFAKSIDGDPSLFDSTHTLNEGLLEAKLQDLTNDHNLQATYVISTDGHILGSTQQRGMHSLPVPNASELAEAARGTIEVDYPQNGIVTALVPMHTLNALLLLARSTDPKVFAWYLRTKTGVETYKGLEGSTRRVQLIFAALYGEVSLLILLAAIWAGLWAANRLVLPLSRLIGAAERVAEGDLKAQVEVGKGDDEIAILGRTFNRMTAQLLTQRNELVEASHLNDVRRRFTEAVLAGVSAGVIGLDVDGRITIVNRAAARLLNSSPAELVSQHYSEAVPELAGLIRRALQEPIGRAGGEATVKRGGTVRSLSVQVDSEKDDAGYIVTFDDITDLVSAQRTAAWADVARRIAHEIKNPLTPIQLSAERLKRKYGGEVTSDPEIFRQCTDTIIRQVGDIGRMVDEFSSFARMPTPTMRRENAQELLHQSVFLQRVAHPQIAFETKAPVQPMYFECDGRLVSQALTNVLKNATEAIAAREAGSFEGPGRIAISLEEKNERLVYRIADNGVGLPAQHRHRLTEPYVTTRTKGTGLGLAIVKKILEDHGGEVTLADREDEETGAEVRLSFPLRQRSDRESKTDMRVGVG